MVSVAVVAPVPWSLPVSFAVPMPSDFWLVKLSMTRLVLARKTRYFGWAASLTKPTVASLTVTRRARRTMSGALEAFWAAWAVALAALATGAAVAGW